MNDHRENPGHHGPDRRDFLQTAGLVGAGLALSGVLARGPSGRRRLELSNTGPDRIPRKPFGKTKETVSVIGIGGYSLGRRPVPEGGHRHRPRGHRRRRQLLRQRLGVPRRQERGVDGPGAQGAARQGLPDDQGLHPRPRQEGGHAAARGIAEAACRPTTSTCGRSTSASTTTIPSGTSPRAA